MLQPAQVSEKWNRRMKSAGPDVQAGVDAVQTAPSAQAIQKKDKFRQNLLKSIDDGTWEANLGKFSLGDYKNAMKTKGIPNMQNGIDSGTPKMTAFMQVALPHIASGQAAIGSMPDLTLQDSKNRSAAWIDHMAQLNYKKRR
jgi:hypothetical protein